MSGPAPLLQAFRLVRTRIPRLGIGEYVALLRALEGGFAAGPRELTALCQALWAKSAAEQRQVAEVLEALLPTRETEDEEDDPRPPVPPEPARPEPVPDRPVPEAPVPAPSAEGGSAGGGSAEGAEEPQAGWVRAAGPAALVAGLPLTAPFDLEGSLPVTRRQMSRAWRVYRRMGRRGPPVEVDAEATVRRIYREGILTGPVLVPRRTNQARALILEDTGGSMVPFRYVSAELVEAARHAGLSRVDVRYFHDVAVDVVFRDPALMAPVTLEDALGRFVDAGVLVYSDAGAARGGMDALRVERTAALVALLDRATPNVAWLNPVPSERWAGTTAEAVVARTGVAMFPLDRAGLERAVDRMRGMSR